MEKIDLTTETSEKIEVAFTQYMKAGTSTDPADRPKVEAAIRRIYAREGIELVPEIIWAEGLEEARTILAKAGASSAATNLWGAMDLPYYARFDFARKHLYNGITPDAQEIEDNEELDDVMAIASAWYWWPFDDCLVLDKPSTLRFDEAGELHCDNGPAIEFRNGEQIFFIHGHEVTKKIVMEKESITIKDIQSQPNDEVRRIMIDAYGPGRYAEELGATVIAKDESCGHPRFLVRLNDGSLWYLGTDGGTIVDGKPRVYWMASFQGVSTCSEAHSRIAGFDEARISDRC